VTSKEIHVVGAVIVRDGLILCARRGPRGALAGLWEFPGGKVEPDESHREALIREIDEELGCRIEVGDEVATTTHAYDFATITLSTYWCRIACGTPRPTEHEEVRWVAATDLVALEWAPADIPAVEIIANA